MKNAALLCRHLNVVLAIASVLLTAKATGQVTAHTRQELFNAGWEFRREGEAGWTAVTLPHDAALDQGYDRTLDPDQGFARAPRTVYRKSFVRPSGEGRFALRFDGVHLESSVSLNGRRVGGFHTGYLPFEVPLENLAPTNTVEVDVSAPQGNAREAELFLNGRSQGVRRFADTKDLHLSWDVAYEPGVLEVRAKMADGTVVTDRKVSAGPAVRYRVTKDFAADGLVFFRVDAVDRDGNRVIACEDAVRVKVSSGTLVATDNGDATDHTPFASPVRRLFRGSLLVIVREAVAGDPTLEVFGASGERGSRGPDFSAGVSVVEDRPGIQDSGNANAVVLGDGQHAVAYYSGQEPDAAVYVLRGASH